LRNFRLSPKANRCLLLLATGTCMLWTHPDLRVAVGFAPGPYEAIGPNCLLSSAPAPDAIQGIWSLEGENPVVPFDLVLAGYPENSLGLHPLVTRVTCTAYSSTIAQCDSTPFETATLKRPRRGYLALSRDLIATFTPGAPFDFGDRVEIIGLGVYQVEDTMNARWRLRADLWVPSTGEAISFGRRTVLLARLAERPVDMALATNPVAESSASTDL
jgi:3D (Asp-Asp-Asp) domain-containing protein